MTGRVFMHVGLPKTGTTFLQNALWEHRESLRRRGLLVPGRHRRRHLLATLDLREDPKLSSRPGDTRAPWQDLVDEIVRWPGDALISHEFFGAAQESGIVRARDSFPDAELHVILTARDMVSLGVSRWQEWVKNGGKRTVDAYPPERGAAGAGEWGWASFDLADVLRRWGAVLPHHRIHVLPMSPSMRDPAELWRRFLGVMGVAPEGLAVADEPANTSLGLVEIELLRRVNAHLEMPNSMARGVWIRGYLGEGHILRGTGEKLRPGPEKLTELGRRGREAVALLESGEYDVVGDLALLEPTDVSGRRHPAEVEHEEIADAAAYAVARLVEDVRSLTAERNQLLAARRPTRWGDQLRVRLARVHPRRPRGRG